MALDPAFALVLGGLVIFVFFVYLLVRRTVLGFREGYDRGQN